jgi:hypothetical protein
MPQKPIDMLSKWPVVHTLAEMGFVSLIRHMPGDRKESISIQVDPEAAARYWVCRQAGCKFHANVGSDSHQGRVIYWVEADPEWMAGELADVWVDDPTKIISKLNALIIEAYTHVLDRLGEEELSRLVGATNPYERIERNEG